MCTPLECQAHFGQQRTPHQRSSRRCAEFLIVAVQMARGSPSRPQNTQSVLLGKVNWHGLAHTLGDKRIFEDHEWEIEAPLDRQPLFGKVVKVRRFGRSPDGRAG